MIKTEYDKEKNVLTCLFDGKMDMAASQTVAAQFEQAWREVQPRASIVFDMAAVTFVASAFLRTCLQAAKLAGQERFKMINTSPAVQKILQIAGIEQFTMQEG